MMLNEARSCSLACKAKGKSPGRLTVTLAPGQRKVLEAIAARNHAALAYVVRYALTEFIEVNRDRKLRLSVPESVLLGHDIDGKP